MPRAAQPHQGRAQTSPEPSHSGHSGRERQREKGLGLPPSPPVAKATALLEMDAGEARADRACGWSTSGEPGRGLRRGGGGLLDGESLSHLHPSSVAMETVRAPSPVPAAATAAA